MLVNVLALVASCSPSRLTVTQGHPVTGLGTEERGGTHSESLEMGLKERVRAEESSSSADTFRDRKA